MNMQLSTTLLPLLAAALFIATSPAQAADGEAIVKKARCVACHAVDQKRVGPAYKDVAAKYKGDTGVSAKLFDKVREGGGGNWGDTPMIPHPSSVISDFELKAAIEWILDL
ncbi:MAG: c-type cytochrome [Dechloromonas sp.]|nr:c-type cytochrome [Dechloromonas sp.]